MMKSCIVIGAGISGLSAANVLSQAGVSVHVLDKSRGIGGRMATRRIETPLATYRCDHGAQFIKATTPEFQAVLANATTENVLNLWYSNEKNQPCYSAYEGMTGFPKFLAQELNIYKNQKVIHIVSQTDQWNLQVAAQKTAEQAANHYISDGIILTAPLPQSLALLTASNLLPSLALLEELQTIQYAPCFALMVGLKEPSKLPVPGYLRFQEGPIASIADNQMKKITSHPSLTIIASPDFTRTHFDDSPEKVQETLLSLSQPFIGRPTIIASQLHRWRFSHPLKSYSQPYLEWESPHPLLLAGDAFGGAKVEGAFLSGLKAGQRMLECLVEGVNK